MKLTNSEMMTLLRCLSYGENAISRAEEENGTGREIRENVENIRRKLCSEMWKTDTKKNAKREVGVAAVEKQTARVAG